MATARSIIRSTIAEAGAMTRSEIAGEFGTRRFVEAGRARVCYRRAFLEQLAALTVDALSRKENE
jgi:hypothetical protein